MRYFLDTEYLDDGRDAQLISIALVADDDREFLAVSSQFDAGRASEWVRANVLPHLPDRGDPRWMSPAQIRDSLRAFVGDSPEFWSACAEWDWYLLVRLFGSLNDLPRTWPLTCWDLWQWSFHLGSPELPQHTGVQHDALADARWHRDVFKALEQRAKQR